jgi:DNA (cytosine-5)-methyltransferase 1
MDHLNSLLRTALSEPRTKTWAESLGTAVSALNSIQKSASPAIEIGALTSHLAHHQDSHLIQSWKKNELKLLTLDCLKKQPLPHFNSTNLKRHPTDNWIDFTFMDLFAGIGGFHLALSSQGGTLAFASEIDNSARTTYAMNFGVIPFGDIRTFTRTVRGDPRPLREIAKIMPRVDIIAAGFPCQPFSLAGVSSRNFHGIEHGLKCEAQGTLFEDILLVARATKPDALILENVRNLASHDSGKTIRVIRSEITKAGYQIFPKWDESKNWGVINSLSVIGQRRKRVYMVCIRNDLAKNLASSKGPFEMPKLSLANRKHSLRQVIEADNEHSELVKFKLYGISKKLWLSHQKRDKNHALKNNGFRTNLMTDLNEPAPTLVARYYKDGKDCLIPHRDRNRPPRMLTPRECGLLQTFPPTFWIPASKTPAYKQFGNAITVEVARVIARSLTSYLYT